MVQTLVQTDEVCSICLKHVEDSDSGLQCDVCDSWKHSQCLGVSDNEYDRLINSDEDFYCPTCSTSRLCGTCGLLIDKNTATCQVIVCRSSCDRIFHVDCVDPRLRTQGDGNLPYWECAECFIPPHIPPFAVRTEDKDRAKWHGLHGDELFVRTYTSII